MITVNISARVHEEARVASARFALPAADLHQAEAEIDRQLAVTVLWSEEKELLIGHAKAYLSWGEDEARMLSTTGGPVETKGSQLPGEPQKVEIGITIIIFGGELEDAEERLKGMSSAIIGQFGEWCSFVCECEHEHDHHDHDHHHDHHGHDHDHGGHEHGHHHEHENGENGRCR